MSRTRLVAGNLLVAVVCGAATVLGGLFAYGHFNVAWPQAGIGLAIVLMLGPRFLPGIGIGVFAGELWLGGWSFAAFAIALGNTAEVALGGWIVQRLKLNVTAERVRDVIGGLLVSVAAPLPAAVIGTSALMLGETHDVSDFGRKLASWWIGDSVGIMVFTPLLLGLGLAGLHPTTKLFVRAARLLTIHAAVAWLVFSGALFGVIGHPTIVYLLFPLTVWIALVCGPTATSIAVLMSLVFGAWGLHGETGAFAAVLPGMRVPMLQMFVVVSGATAFVVYAFARERRFGYKQLQSINDRLQTITALSADWYWEQDDQLRFTHLSDNAGDKAVIPSSDTLGKTRFELGLQFASGETVQRHQQALEAHQPFRDLVAHHPQSGRWVMINGEPRFDRHGCFTGYRGIGRDITALKRTENELAASARFLDAVIDAVPTSISVKDPSHQLIMVNEAYCGMAGMTRDQLLGQSDHLLMAQDDVAYVWEKDDEALASSQPVQFERAWAIGGTERWTLTRKFGLTGPDNQPVVVSSTTDITSIKEVELQLRASERRFRDFAEAAGEYVWETDAEGRFSFVSSRIKTVLGYDASEMIGRRDIDFMPPEEPDRVATWIEDHTRLDGSYRDLEHRFLNKGGDIVWVQVNAVRIASPDGRSIGRRGTCRDVTDRRKADERISVLATRDTLTGLPNRMLFNDRLEQGLVNARRSKQSVALMFIDLDRFKNINDSLGHDVGDLLLKEVAVRMQGCIRKGDTLSRLGGDEFVVTLEGLQQAEDAAQVARKIINALAQPMLIAGHMLTTSCSLGIAIFPEDAEDSAALMKNADTAMYHAKERGRRNFQFFSRAMNLRAVERQSVETALRLALDRDEFELVYQPQVDIASGRMAGMEALLRWRHPERGLLPPAAFIDVAEDTGLVEPIGQWVLRAACMQSKAWIDAGLPAMRVSVNISARQFNQPRQFSRAVNRVLAATGLDPGLLELEMTEGVLLHHAEENIQALRRLGKLGLRIAIDDFGTGYSSLSYLKQLPIHSLKIDRSFVRDLDANNESEIIVNTIIAMGHALKLRITAEGVENLAQLSALKRLGCDEYQGFLFSKGIKAPEFAQRFLAPRELNFGS